MTTIQPADALNACFPRAEAIAATIPVWCCTPNEGRCLHRFFDTSPLSPDGTRLAVFRVPFEDRLPGPGERGQVVLVDLRNGQERIVSETAGWEPQLGCNLNWADDRTLVFNDVDTDTWTPQLVSLDVDTAQTQRLAGGVYHVSPDGRYAAAASMEKMRRTQPGYGVVVPDEHSRRNVGAVDDDGLFITDLQTMQRRLVLSLAQAAKVIPDLQNLSENELAEWEIYGFHCKWNPQGDRLIFTVRRYRHMNQDRFNAFGRRNARQEVRFDVLTLRPDGSEVYDAVPAEKWTHGGHHINFYPDGQRLSMNLGYFTGGDLELVKVNHDGSDLARITDAVPGSGHPTVHPDGRHILTDCYVHEKWTHDDGTTPLRWIDLNAGVEQEIARMRTRVEPGLEAALRVDPHPAWDRSWKWVCFNAFTGGTRRVYLADMRSLLDA